MTYAELKFLLESLTAEQLACTATVYDLYEHEFIAVSSLKFATKETDVLDESHPFMEIKE